MYAAYIASLLLVTAAVNVQGLLSFRPIRVFPSPVEILGGSSATILPAATKNAVRVKRDTKTAVPVPISEPQSLPWTQSVNPSRDLTYMPALEAALSKIREMSGIKEIPLESKFVYRTSDVKPARIGNMLFQNEQFRKIRLTYFDAGDAVQVFNMCFFPSFEYDLPMLGVDLISLGKGRVLSVVDFQPLHPTDDYAEKYISPLTEIKAKYTDLHGTLSGKIYDDTSFFSKNMLFGRFSDESKILDVVTPAMTEYLQHYLHTMSEAVPNSDPAAMKVVEERQITYDAYSALKDPAVGLFDAYFGKDWSASFVHDYLFSLSDAEVTAQQHALSKAGPGAAANTGSAPHSASSSAPSGGVVHKFTINSTTGAVSPAGQATGKPSHQ